MNHRRDLYINYYSVIRRSRQKMEDFKTKFETVHLTYAFSSEEQRSSALNLTNPCFSHRTFGAPRWLIISFFHDFAPGVPPFEMLSSFLLNLANSHSSIKTHKASSPSRVFWCPALRVWINSPCSHEGSPKSKWEMQIMKNNYAWIFKDFAPN